jgi:cyclopropane fatty-acyl-phospholipid synthase-like methyltransferase
MFVLRRRVRGHGRGLATVENRMETRWEQLARENAEFYIWTDGVPGEGFFESGERDARHILEFSSSFVAGRDQALEIGCGVGRMTVAMARAFGRITAVDVAPTMLAKLEENCRTRGIENVRALLPTERWDLPASVDFAYTRIVLQHIEDWQEIEMYFKRVAASLKGAGGFYVQFDTRPATVLYRVRNAVPDPLLPRTYRRGVRRIRRRPADLHGLAKAVGLRVVAERGLGTADHELVLLK